MCVQIKMHFGCQIVKPLLIGNSLMMKESEAQVKKSVANNIEDKLRKRLLEAMQFKVSKLQLTMQVSDADTEHERDQAAFATRIQDVMR